MFVTSSRSVWVEELGDFEKVKDSDGKDILERKTKTKKLSVVTSCLVILKLNLIR